MTDESSSLLPKKKRRLWRVVVSCSAIAVSTSLLARVSTWTQQEAALSQSAHMSLRDVYVAKTYYINLAESTERRANMERQLAAVQGVPYARVEATAASTSDDLAGDLGDVVAARLGCDCVGSANRGLCCLRGLGWRGAAAVEMLTNESNLCGHQTAHVWSVVDGSHAACFHMMANWASHVRALETARDELGANATERDHILVLEDDSDVPADWVSKLHAAKLASPRSSNVLEAMLGIASSGANDQGRWDYIRADLDAFDTQVHINAGNPTSTAIMSPLTAGVDWESMPDVSMFAWGAGALLVRVASIDTILASISDCLDIDVALNLGSAKGQTRMATLRHPLFHQDKALGADTTI